MRNIEEEVKIIQINLSYGVKDNEKIRIYRMQDDSGKRYVENLIIYDVNMEYYKKIWYDKNTKEIEKNKYIIMMDLDKSELKEISKDDKVVHKYMEDLENLNGNQKFREYMTYEMDQKIIHNTELYEARKEGLERGIEKGTLEGERQEKLSIARMMLKAGEDIKKIMLYTSLTKEEIELLK